LIIAFGKIPNIRSSIGAGEDMEDRLKTWQVAGNQLGALLVFGKRIARAIGGIQVRP
jgi:hypothetical protein